MYESKSDLTARLTKIDSALDKAREAQSYQGGDFSVTRAYKQLLAERAEVIRKINMIEQADDGMPNKVEFNRPT